MIFPYSNVLVTGGAGFVGSHIVDGLLELGCNVTVYDNMSNGSKNNIPEKAKFIQGDINDKNTLSLALKDQEVIFHEAGMVDVQKTMREPEAAIHSIVDGTKSVLEVAVRMGVKQLVYASTSAIFGDSPELPRREDTPPNPKSPYGRCKLVAEHACLDYQKLGLETTILRYFNCYDKETELLTDHGWKLFSDLDRTETVATLNQQINMMEFQQPTEYFKFRYQGKMVHVSGNQLDCLVTPNHRMWRKVYFSSRSDCIEAGPYGIEAADSLLSCPPHTIGYQLSTNWDGQNDVNPLEIKHYTKTVGGRTPFRHRYYRYEGVPDYTRQYAWYNEDWIRFMAWYLSEGSVHHDGTSYKRNEVSIRQCKDISKLREIFDIILRLGFHTRSWDQTVRDERVTISDRGLAEYLRQFGNAREKFIPDEIKRLPVPLLRIFIETYQKGDGYHSVDQETGVTLSSGIVSFSTKMRDDLQEIITKAGWSSSQKGSFVTIARKRTEARPIYTPTLHPYDDDVYCVSVPNTILYVRRNGKAMFCGNCYGVRSTVKAYSGVINVFAQNIVGGKDLTIFGDGSQTRDFISVHDIVQANILAASSPLAKNQTFNVGTGIETSIRHLASLQLDHFKSRSKVNYDAFRVGDVRRTYADISRIHGLLGFVPKTPFKEGLDAYLSEVYPTPEVSMN